MNTNLHELPSRTAVINYSLALCPSVWELFSHVRHRIPVEIYFTQTSQTFTDNVVHSHAKSQSFAKFLRRLRRLRESFSHRRHGRHRILAARFCLTQTAQTFTDDVVDSHAKAQSIAKFSAHVCVVCVRQKYVLLSKTKFCVILCVLCAHKPPCPLRLCVRDVPCRYV